ncbi:MAG: gas vesicle protein GvpG [Candidatus Sericytochromatia bacterium]
MGLLSGILLMPLAPVRGVVWLGEVIQRQVEQEMHNPANTRRQLEELEEARERGEITSEEEKTAQQEILQARIRPDTPDTETPETG